MTSMWFRVLLLSVWKHYKQLFKTKKSKLAIQFWTYAYSWYHHIRIHNLNAFKTYSKSEKYLMHFENLNYVDSN